MPRILGSRTFGKAKGTAGHTRRNRKYRTAGMLQIKHRLADIGLGNRAGHPAPQWAMLPLQPTNGRGKQYFSHHPPNPAIKS
jgi:hypothetical protein